MRPSLVVALLVAVARASLAATVSVTIDPPGMRVGEAADLAVAVEGTQNAATPVIRDTGGLSISYVGPASQMSFVNGRVSSSITHHFTVVGTKPGRYVIGPVTVAADGKTVDAGTVTVEVLAAGADGGGGSASDQLTLDLSAPRTEVYLRERVPLAVTLRVGSVRVTDLQYPQVPADGVALEKFPEPAQRREQTARGVAQVVEFRTTLTPLKAGTVTIGPATMSMSLVVQGRRNRGFFGGFFDEARPVEIKSSPLTLGVLPLPTEGRPRDFTGAVGQFTFDVSATPLDVAAGDPVTVRTTIRGDGSLDGVAPPALPGGDTLRVYPPQAAQGTQAAGERVFEQVVIPLKDGPTTLPPLRFSYFDPAARAYRTVAPPPPTLAVRPSATAHAAPEIVGARPAAPTQAARPETLGRDIVFIKDALGPLRPIGARAYAHPLAWAAQILPVGLWAIASAVGRRRRRLSGDVRYARFTRAGREARAALASAETALARGDVAAGHDAVAAAMRDYLAAKLDLPPGTAGDTAPQRLRAAGVDETVADAVAAFFAACEAARFAPGGASAADVKAALARADGIVRALERARRIAPARATATVALVLAVAALAGAADGPSALFIRANGLYGDGRYADAAAVYERILATGVESEAAQYNLGNAYLKAGDVGRAVLAYERASRLAPADPDVVANLGFARELAHDVAAPSLVERLAFPLATRSSTSRLFAGAAVAWWIVWLALATAALVPAARPLARAAAVASGIAAVLLGSSGAYRWWTVERPRFAVVVAHDDATVRSEPSASATTLFVAKPGTVLEVERVRDAASLVTSRDGRRGWIESATLADL